MNLLDFFSEIKIKFIILFTIFVELFKNILNIRRKCRSDTRLDGKVVVITGANTGIGKETALELSLRGAKIIIGSRDVDRGKRAVQDIQLKNPKANIIVMKLDLSSLSSVRHFAKTVSREVSTIDILMNNAGVMACPESTTEEGFEMQFGTNHLGHYLLTLSLMPLLKKSPKARIITVSSIAHMSGSIHFENINLRNKAYDPMTAYRQSKLANILFTRQLSRRLGPKSNINVYCLHPGIIRTELWRHNSSSPVKRLLHKLLLIDSRLGAQTSLYCALDNSLDNESGFYYDDCRRVDDCCMVPVARDDNTAELLWNLSSDLVKLEDHFKLDLIK